MKRLGSFYLFNICKIFTFMFTLNKFSVSIFTHHVITQFYSIESIYFDRDYPLTWIHQSVFTTLLSFLLFSGWFIENESKFVINFTSMTYHVKFNHSLQALSHKCLNTKCVSSYFGARILMFICKIS